VPIPSKVRAAPKVKEVQNIAGGAQVAFAVSCEREGTEKPVCVAETVVRVYTGYAQRWTSSVYGAENADALPALSIARTTYVLAPSTRP
jgi:hypothetical protein